MPNNTSERELFRGLKVVGTFYRGKEIQAFLKQMHDDGLVQGPARLVAEEDNPHDPDAVAVYIGQHHVGYVPATISRLVKDRLLTEPEYTTTAHILNSSTVVLGTPE